MKVINKYGQLIESVSRTSTVTMAGKDYTQLLQMAADYEAIVKSLNEYKEVRLSGDDEDNLEDRRFVIDTGKVTIVDQLFVDGMVRRILEDDKMVEVLAMREEHYYKPGSDYLADYLWSDELGIDLLEYPEFKERFEATQERNAQVTEADKDNVFIEMADHTEFDSVKEVE